MKRISPIAWTDADRALWARIADHDFEPAGHSLSFTARFARDHGWSVDRARSAVTEYRRFCFLALRAGFEVTPSEEVDEVWHQHLTYSRDYWQVWCLEILGSELHHQPTKGGPAENRRFAEQYARTLACYEAWFGPPPEAFWPGATERFGPRPRFRIVDSRTAVVVRRPGRRIGVLVRRILPIGLALVGIGWTGAAEAETWNVLDWPGEPFLLFYLAAAILSLLAAYGIPLLLTIGPSRGRDGDPLKPVELALVAVGRRRAVDTLALEALDAGRATINGRNIVIDGATVNRARFARSRSATLDEIQADLAARGLALSAERFWLVRTSTFGLVLPVIALGLAKVMVGTARDKPVGFLVVLLAVTAVATIAMTVSRRPATQVGRRLVRMYRETNARALRMPTRDEAITAFACVGAAALVGTVFADYGALIRQASSGGGGCSGGSGCGGGGGGGGGGCGGCGGGH